MPCGIIERGLSNVCKPISSMGWNGVAQGVPRDDEKEVFPHDEEHDELDEFKRLLLTGESALDSTLDSTLDSALDTALDTLDTLNILMRDIQPLVFIIKPHLDLA